MKINKNKNITTPQGENATYISFTDENNNPFSSYVFDNGKIQVTTNYPYDDAE